MRMEQGLAFVGIGHKANLEAVSATNRFQCFGKLVGWDMPSVLPFSSEQAPTQTRQQHSVES